jgi:hypothetical protein
MLRLYMYKYFIFFLFTPFVLANEPTLAKMVSVDSNELQKLSIANYSFYCRPYGVITLDRLYKRSELNSGCKAKIKSYYQHNPQDLYFAESLFKKGQWYHLEFKQNSCVIYAQGEYTFSELLLKKGLAVREPQFSEREFKASFYKAQKVGRTNERGVWKDDVLKNCLAEIYK